MPWVERRSALLVPKQCEGTVQAWLIVSSILFADRTPVPAVLSGDLQSFILARQVHSVVARRHRDPEHSSTLGRDFCGDVHRGSRCGFRHRDLFLAHMLIHVQRGRFQSWALAVNARADGPLFRGSLGRWLRGHGRHVRLFLVEVRRGIVPVNA